MKISLYALLKFGAEKYMRDLCENGNMYFNTIEGFRKEEDGGLRGDKYEGNVFVSNTGSGQVYVMEGDKETLAGDCSNVHTRMFREDLKGNLYCMYAIHPDSLVNGKMSFDRKILEFGSHFVAIQAPLINPFLQRVHKQLLASGRECSADLVKYYDPEEGLLNLTNVFMKRKSYAFENEFRIFVPNDVQEPFTISLGSLKDVATFHETASIFSADNSQETNT